METQSALSGPNTLGRHLAVVSAQRRGVGPEQLRWIGVDPAIFEAFYREHVEGVQLFVARRVGERERAADLTAEIFLAAIDRLPETERAVLELVALDELTVAEAAAAVGLRPVTARVRLYRARRKLRAELESHQKEDRP